MLRVAIVSNPFNQMSPSEYAAWWGATVATIVLIWDVIKWRARGPRLRTLITQDPERSASGFKVYVSNTGDLAATIESVNLRCFELRRFGFKHEIDGFDFGLSGNDGFPPLTLQPGQPWEGFLGPHGIVNMPKVKLRLVVEIQESHRKKPYRYYPESKRFNEYVQKKSLRA